MEISKFNSLIVDKTTVTYVAEGNANLVVKLPDRMQVLRLPKSDGSAHLTIQNYLLNTKRYVTFLSRILNSQYIPVPEIIELTAKNLDLIDNYTKKHRPAHRLSKGLNARYGLLLPDATIGTNDKLSTYAVEIKPKQGWLIDDNLSDLFHMEGVKKCRYCCMQFLKMHEGKISSRSKYCPMDLFSGNFDRMRNSIMALLAAPQNNLRIFKDGRLIFSEAAHHQNVPKELFADLGENNFYKLLVSCLLGCETFCDEIGTQQNSTYKSQCNLDAQLPASSILRNVLDLQLLSKHNIPYISKKIVGNSKTYEALNQLTSRGDLRTLDELTAEEQYMIGATFMDASIMITFHGATDDDLQTLPNERLKLIDGKTYATKVTMLDLDPKPDNHFQKYLKQTNEAFKITRENDL